MADFSTDKEKKIREQSKDDYKKLFAILESFLEDFFDDPEQYVTQEEIMEERALQILSYAFAGYGLTLEEAIEKIKKSDIGILTENQIAERKMLMEVLDNLVDFAVSEQYQMLRELESDADEFDEYDDFFVEASKTSEKFNSTYASIENADSWYAMGMALAWASMSNGSIITYYTQGDERVRDSHRAFDGVSYTKSEFPAELMPPIDWACRCYLVESSDYGLLGKNPSDIDEMISSTVNPIFKKPYQNGAIFGSTHPYFDVYEKDVDDLKAMVTKIKNNLLS
ncbi:MAG: phage minor head protein [Bacteroidales bacterium]